MTFMHNFATLTRDLGLIAVTRDYWLGETPPRGQRIHRFGCQGARWVELPKYLYSLDGGRLLVPSQVQVVFDVSSAEGHEVSYGIYGEVSPDGDSSHMMLSLGHPRDVGKASWQFVISPPGEEDTNEPDITIPVDGAMSKTNNLDFSEIIAATEEALVPALFTRIEPPTEHGR